MAETTGTNITSLQIEISSSSKNASEGIEKLTKSLDELKGVLKGNVVGGNLQKIGDALGTIKNNIEGLDKLGELGKNLSSLTNIKSSGLSSTFNALKKIPDVVKTLDDGSLTKFTSQMKKLSKSLTPIATKMSSISKGFNALGGTVKVANKNIKTLSKTTSSASPVMSKFDSVVRSVRLRLLAITFVFKQVIDGISGCVKQSNDYIENMNIFTVAMGDMYEEAMAYAQTVNEKLGIDISEWTRNQAVFSSMATGFGVADEAAYKLSKGLTELSYDLASFFNMETEEAFNKVRSGLAGELEPLRAVGFALDQATLQQVAYAHGVDLAYSSMTQSQKAILRYTAMVEQASKMGAIGDLANTLKSPANAIRILKSQFTQLARAIGNVFLPIISQVIPYVQAVVRVLTDLISKLAVLVGFEMPKWEPTDWDKTSSAINEATESAKEYKNATMGFDELNVINPPESAGAGNGYGADLGIEIAEVWDKGLLDEVTSKTDILVGKIYGFFETIKNGVSSLFDFENGISGLGIALGILGGVAFAGLLLKLPLILGHFGALAGLITSVKSWSDVVILFSWAWEGVAMIFSALLSPITLITGAIAIVVGAFIQLYNTSEEFRTKVNDLITLIGGTFKTILEDLKSIVTSVKDVFVGLWKDAIVPLWNFIVAFLEPIFIILIDVLTMLWKYIIEPLATTISNVFVRAFKVLEVVMINSILPAVRSVIDIFTKVWKKILEPFVMWLWSGMKPILEGIGTTIKDVLHATGNAIATSIEGVVVLFGGLVDYLVDVFTGNWKKGWEDVKDLFDLVWFKVTDSFVGIEKAFNNFGKNLIQGMIDGVKSMVSSLMSTITGIVNKVKNAVSNVISMVTGAKESADTVTNGNEKVQAYATGGVVSSGQLFIARESGAELVGSIGNSTSVMNNEQIVQAVSQGVANAVASVMGGNSNQNIVVQLDGEVVYKNQQRVAKRLGYNLGI